MRGRDRVAVVGVGMTELARQVPDKSVLALQAEACRMAVADAGLRMAEVDGLIGFDPAINNPRFHAELAEVLGLYDKGLCFTTMQGGASPGYALEVARWALAAGRVRYVLTVRGLKGSSGGVSQDYATIGNQPRTSRGHGLTDHLARLTMHYPDYEHPYGPLMATFYAAVAQRHMHEYGTTEEQLASIPVAFRHNAGLNPQAVYREPITHADVLNSPMISSPLHRLHCCVPGDGAAALLLTTEERARDLRQRPVYVLGHGGGEAGYWSGFLATGGADRGYSLTRTMGRRAADDAFQEAGVKREDIDFVTVCDNFAITPLVLLEDYGFCGKGEGGAFVGNGDRIKVGGELPVNPHGGALSGTHAVINYQNYVEATLQLRGEAGARQVKRPQLALASAAAGIISTHYATILSSG